MSLPGDPPDAEPSDLQPLLRTLHALGGLDFSHYRESTLRRRIDRRIRLHGLPDLHEYERLLAASPQEAHLLSCELLIGVTQFFRDTAVWALLADSLLPRLIEACAIARPLRIWCPGCSTGEEAFSLAMIYREMCERRPAVTMPGLQILATDLSDGAIARARRGVFPASIAREMSEARLARFFQPHPEGFRIDKSVRDHVIFARHDLLADPPFTRIDMISCRNLLIYLVEAWQQRLMRVFHFSLRPGGALLLGSSESVVGAAESLFEPIDTRLRLFRRRVTFPEPKLHQLLPHGKPRSSLAKDIAVTDPNDRTPDHQASAERLLLAEHTPPAVVVNERGDILNIIGRTGRFLEPAAGKSNWNLHAMTRPGLRDAVARVMKHVVESGTLAEQSAWLIDADQQRHALRIVAQPLPQSSVSRGLVLVIFQPVGTILMAPDGSADTELQVEFERELHEAHQEILRLHAEMRSSREELQAANEELQASNEELQSSNEELTSSQEEMQSLNEELRVLNSELQSRLDELALAQSDMRNLLTGLDVATVFLDDQLRVRRFTEHTRRVFRLRESDIGRPLDDLSGSLDYPEMQRDVREVLSSLVACERAVASRDGRWYSVRIGPYRDSADQVRGAVLTFVDITATKLLEIRVRGG